MNKRLVSCFLATLLLLSLLPAAAFAEGNIVVNLGSVRAGSPLELQIATTDAGTASLADGSLPDGCSISTEERGGSFAHYLSGTPKNAGSYEFTLKVTDTVVIISNVTANSDAEDEEPEETVEPEVTPEPTPEPTPEVTPEPEERIEEITVATLKCSLTVLPDVPELTVKDVSCFVGEEARIELQATVNDGGTLSYQWYRNAVKDNREGELLKDKTERELRYDMEFVGENYFYCVVTNTNNGQTETVTSPVVTVTATEPTITSLAIASLPTKLEYTEGDTIDTKGLTLTVHYSNGTVVTEDEGFTVSPTKLEKPGTQTITVTYLENTVTFPVIVNEEKEVTDGIAVTTLPNKREYQQGERLDTEGLVLQVITNKGNRSTVTSGFSCSPEVLNTAGIQTITVSYEGKTASFTVTVRGGEKTVEKIAIETMPSRLTYQVGDSFDAAGLVLRVTTDQGDELVRSGFMCSPSRFTREGTQTVTISYGGQSCTMELTVSPAPEKPAETAAPEKPAETAAPERGTKPADSDKSGESRAQRASSIMLVVILITALAALAALVAYVYVTRQDEIKALWQRLTGRAEPEDEEDGDSFDDDK